MAGPLVIAGSVGGGAARAAGRAGLQKLKELLIQIGVWEAIQAAANDPTAVLTSMYDSLTKSGGDLDRLAASKDNGRKVLLIESARQGVYLDESAGLSRAEATRYANLVKEFGAGLSASADANQVSRPEVEDPMVADAAYMLSMARVCNRLGLSGPNRFRQLYEIAIVINTIQEVDVQKAETHESMFGAMRT